MYKQEGKWKMIQVNNVISVLSRNAIVLILLTNTENNFEAMMIARLTFCNLYNKPVKRLKTT